MLFAVSFKKAIPVGEEKPEKAGFNERFGSLTLCAYPNSRIEKSNCCDSINGEKIPTPNKHAI
jgi:hypothetical protein